MTRRPKKPLLPALLAPGTSAALVVYGAPRTKKTHNRIVRAKGRLRVMPSHTWILWLASARVRLLGRDGREQLWTRPARPLLDWPVNCEAHFFRDANRGDAVGYYQGLADLLERFNIVRNDRQLVSWDRSRLAVDAENPRVEILLTPTVDFVVKLPIDRAVMEAVTPQRNAYADWVEAELRKGS